MHPPPFNQLARLGVVLVITLMIGVFGAGNAAWATPGQRPGGQTVPTATPGGGAPTPIPTPTPNANVEQALALPGVLRVASLFADGLPAADPDFTLIGRPIRIMLFDQDGDPMDQLLFSRPLQICFDYNDDDLALVGSSPETFVVRAYDDKLGSWVKLSTTMNVTDKRVCGVANGQTLFALTGDAIASATNSAVVSDVADAADSAGGGVVASAGGGAADSLPLLQVRADAPPATTSAAQPLDVLALPLWAWGLMLALLAASVIQFMLLMRRQTKTS